MQGSARQKQNNMRQLVIQYPDGKYHTIQAYRFYGVLVNGKEEYVLEYDDLTENHRNCFTVLDKEGNTFVKKPLPSREDYLLFASRIRFTNKKLYNLDILPGRIGLCNAALQVLNGQQYNYGLQAVASPASPPPGGGGGPSDPKITIIVYRDVAINHDSFPYYLDAKTAGRLGLSKAAGGYYHLTRKELDNLKKKYIIEYKDVVLGLGPIEVEKEGSPKVQVQPRRLIIIYVDVATNHDTFPYYLDANTAKALGFKNIVNGYYHLNPKEVEEIKNNFDIQYKNETLGFGPVINPRKNEIRNIYTGGTGVPTPPSGPTGSSNNSNDKIIVVYEDIAPIREEYPFYIDKHTANTIGLKTTFEYYHLRTQELDVIKRYATVKFEQRYLAILDQGLSRKIQNRVVNTEPVKLTNSEEAELERLFDNLMNFEDYFSFFGIEELRNVPVARILSCKRIVELTELFKKGIACNNEIAINLAEFLEGFKKSLKDDELIK